MSVDRDRVEWLEHLRGQGFPLEEYHSCQTAFARWKELATWHEELRRKWNRDTSWAGSVRRTG